VATLRQLGTMPFDSIYFSETIICFKIFSVYLFGIIAQDLKQTAL
jgi:hypothetical protein